MSITTHVQFARVPELEYQPHRLRVTGCEEQFVALNAGIEEKIGSNVTIPLITVSETIDVDLEQLDYHFA